MYLLIGSRRKLNSVTPPSVKIKDDVINRVTHCKYLDVQIDQHLHWARHVECMQKKLHKCLYLLKRIRPFINKQMAMIFYETIIQSKIDYCSVIWQRRTVIMPHLHLVYDHRRVTVNWSYPSNRTISLRWHTTIVRFSYGFTVSVWSP